MLLEAVPNLSEGRDRSVLKRLARVLDSAPGIHRLDLSADPDHHRSVWTLVGESRALVAGLFEFHRAALSEIDLKSHKGVHPRVGVVDVTPFVPLGESRMRDAVEAARTLGSRLGEELGLPVFLYEAAAQHPDRRNLADIRRGGLPRLAERAAAGWKPDFGPSSIDLHRGASVVGARDFLVAFNAVLATADLRVARKIARSIRQSNGGLPSVKAMGVYLEAHDRAQVSMNLTNFRKTSPLDALEAIRVEARELDTYVLETEIVGLIPRAALEGTNAEALQIRDFRQELVLEWHLEKLY